MLRFTLIALGAAIAVTTGATYALARPPAPDVSVLGHRIDPDTQRVVSYADLNLALMPDQKTLHRRIRHTAYSLCLYLNGVDFSHRCEDGAVRSTRDQVAAAIGRAKLEMAGLAGGPAVAISMVVAAN